MFRIFYLKIEELPVNIECVHRYLPIYSIHRLIGISPTEMYKLGYSRSSLFNPLRVLFIVTLSHFKFLKVAVSMVTITVPFEWE